MAARLDAVGIVVRDLARSVEFYRLLGLDFPGGDVEDHVEATTASGLRVMLDSEETILSFDPDWKRPQGNSIGLAFLCDSPAEVDEIFALLVGAGAVPHKKPWDAFWGQRYAQVRDPDGHTVDLFASL
ncbi:MAG: VOC family protein [Fimbriimonadaceae bacterium]|nr:VOC family protein [Fimbriimonadaceae bacterium]